MRAVCSYIAGGGECAVCGRKCGALPLCRRCRKKYFAVTPSAGEKRCSVCGRILVSEHGTCMQCRTKKLLSHTDIVFPLYSYRLWNTMLLFRWKIEGERVLSPFFASETAAALALLEPGFTIVPVPPRPGKIREKGWDQIEELSRFLELRYHFKTARILERSSRREQKTLDRENRLETIGSSYSLKKGVSVPAKVCIIDDVLTTGATVESCAAVLKAGGAQTVYAVTLFTVDSA